MDVCVAQCGGSRRAALSAGPSPKAPSCSPQVSCHHVEGSVLRRYADGNGIDLTPTTGLETAGWSPARGLSYSGALRGLDPKKRTVTHFQFVPPTLVRFFTPDDKASAAP